MTERQNDGQTKNGVYPLELRFARGGGGGEYKQVFSNSVNYEYASSLCLVNVRSSYVGRTFCPVLMRCTSVLSDTSPLLVR